jgi:hypothetical protein
MVAGLGRWHPHCVRRRLQGSAGQSTVEWLVVMVGLVALAGALTATLPGVAGAVTGAARSMICTATGTSCGGGSGSGQGPGSGQAPDPAFKPLDPTAPTKGPAIGNNPPDVGADLPFPGSVSATVDENDKGKLGPKSGYKVGVSATFERSTSPCSVDGTGKPSVTLSASADIKVTAGVNGEGKGMGAAISGSIGDKTSYDVKTDPANADRIDRGEVPPPNPADPYSIPKGSSITLNRDSYKGSEGSVAYHNLTAELGYKDGHRVSSAVERVGDDKVRITVGDTDFVENTLGVKVGDENVSAGVSVGNGFQDGKARAVDLDLSTPEGRSAYERFIGSGRLPAPGAPGTSDPTTSVSVTSTHTDTITGKIGPLGGTAGGTTDQGQVVETTHADGTKVTTAFSRRGGTVLAQEYTRDPSGAVVSEKYALQLQDVDKNYVDGYQQLSGHDGETGSNRDLTLNYSPADLDAMQNAALDQILAAQRGWDGSPFKDGGTRDQLRAYLAEHPEADGLAPYGGVKDRIILTDMAAAKDALGVLVALQNSGLGNANEVAEFLMNFHYGTLRARRDLGSTDTRTPLVGGYENRPKGC